MHRSWCLVRKMKVAVKLGWTLEGHQKSHIPLERSCRFGGEFLGPTLSRSVGTRFEAVGQ